MEVWLKEKDDEIINIKHKYKYEIDKKNKEVKLLEDELIYFKSME